MDDATLAVRHLLAFAMLAGAVPSDLLHRRVPNSWWLPFAAMAGVVVLYDLLDPARDPLALLRSYGVALAVAGLMYLLWRFRLFGGADAKALMVLAFLCPVPSPQAEVALVPAFDALANASVLVLVLPLLTLLVNLARGRVAFPAALLGRPMDLQAARAAHVWPMQTVGSDGQVRWRYWQKAALGDLDAEYARLSQAGLRRVWVTAKVPFLVPLAGGLALAWWPGNLLVLLVFRLVA